MTAVTDAPVVSATPPAGGDDPLGDAASLPALLVERARRSPGAVALREKRLGRWRPWTWEEHAERVARVAAGLAGLGLGAGDRVAVLCGNRPAWVVTDLAVQSLGAVTVGVYPTSPVAEVAYVVGHCGAGVVVAEDEEQYDKVIEAWGDLPELRHLVVVDTRGVDLGARPGIISLDELEGRGAEVARAPIDWLAGRLGAVDPGAPAIIVYTSGTTGPPKGAMLSQANLLGAARASAAVFGLGPDDEMLSYLPLCHIAERLLSVVDAVALGYVVNFGEGGESFLTDLQEVQPSFFLGVPRVWEKLMAGVAIRMTQASWLKRGVYRTAERWGAAVARERLAGRFGPLARLRHLLCWLAVFRPLRRKLGLGRVRQALSGAAPIAPQVLEWFWGIGVPVREVYGQTENTALATVMPVDDVRIGTVGRPYPGVEVRRAVDGELATRGPGTFLGYFADPEATAACFDAEGWLLSGDVGEIDADGFVRVVDRKKDLIITAGGKNVAPSEIEGRLKASPFVREALVIGDRRPFLVALIGIEAQTVGAWAAGQGVDYTTYEDLASRAEVRRLIGDAVEAVNRDLASPETIKTFALLPKELDEFDGEVTATQKVKRAAVASEFSALVDALYGSPAEVGP